MLGLIAFGVLHNVLEIRYVAGRFAPVLTGRFLVLLLVLITRHRAAAGSAAVLAERRRLAEIALGYLVLAAGRLRIGLPGALVRGGLASGSRCCWRSARSSRSRFPAYHFVVLTHLHNLVPLVFLWDWARRIPRRGARMAFRLTQVLWIVVLPLIILARRRSTGCRRRPGHRPALRRRPARR